MRVIDLLPATLLLVGCADDTPPVQVTNADTGPAAGNPDGHCAVPGEAAAEDSTTPTTVVGTGTPESCTSAAVIDAVARGGVITFDCGPKFTTIELDAT
ncbi:MAG: hypothetical protein NT062_33755, partial [Proteobacteria bacterium]|nr:hypothetical protein [Pseudomonadota bacterium]